MTADQYYYYGIQRTVQPTEFIVPFPFPDPINITSTGGSASPLAASLCLSLSRMHQSCQTLECRIRQGQSKRQAPTVSEIFKGKDISLYPLVFGHNHKDVSLKT